MINSLKVACVTALKGEEERGIWERESAKGARGGRKREKRRKGSRFQHPRALPPLPLSETLHSNLGMSNE